MTSGNMYLKICAFVSISFLLLTFCGSGGDTYQKNSIHNVIVVTIDTLRADHLPIYGYPRATSPFLSRMAKKGIIFKRCFSPSSHTGPSHASLFTSFFPYQHGLLRNGEGIYPNILTMAQIFANEGYETGGFSAVGFLNPLSRGFDVFNSNKSKIGLFSAKLSKLYKYVLRRLGLSEKINFKSRKFRQGGQVVDQAIDWIQKMKANQKFFLWLHLYDVHEWKSDDEVYVKEVDLVKNESSLNDSKLLQFFTEVQAVNPDFLSEKGLNLIEIMNNYDGRIRYVDSQIKRLFSVIESSKFKGGSLWIITSDHGEGLGNHNYDGHGMNLYNEQLHVPLIIYFSDGSFSGVTVKEMVRLVDVLPTLMEVIQASSVKQSTELEGQSFLSLIHDDKAKFSVEYSFAQRRPADQGRAENWGWNPGEVYSLQSNNHKYILFTQQPDEFYNLNHDPKELNNLIEDMPKNQANLMKDHLVSEIQRIHKSNPTTAAEPNKNQYLEELRSLGYVQ